MITTTRLFPHTLLLALLALFAAGARAEAPFVVNGLHLDMAFSDALVWAQQRGGECRVRDSRSQVGGKRSRTALGSVEAPINVDKFVAWIDLCIDLSTNDA